MTAADIDLCNRLRVIALACFSKYDRQTLLRAVARLEDQAKRITQLAYDADSKYRASTARIEGVR